MAELTVRSLSIRIAGRSLVDRASFSLLPGALVGLLGANGAGKTSLVRGALGLIKADFGEALLNGRLIGRWPAAERARMIGYLPQTRPPAWPMPTRDLVALGRYAHGARLGRLGPQDAAAVARALAACDLTEQADQSAVALSGGELARAHCARALAGEAALLIADEPIAALDPRHQWRIMGLLLAMAREGRGVLAILHDVGLAARFCDRLIWMKDGAIVADGSPADTLSVGRLLDVYGLGARIENGVPHFEGPA